MHHLTLRSGKPFMKFDNTIKIGRLIILSIFLLLNISCKKSPTGPQTEPIFAIEEVACENIWLRVKLPAGEYPVRVTIQGSNKTIQTRTITAADTLLVINGLQAAHAYTCRFQLSSGTNSELPLVTLAKTSDDISWQTWEFSGNSACELLDVTMVDKNNIWAVGDIYRENTDTYDSLGNYINPYNIVHWDGNTWELKRMMSQYDGIPTYTGLRYTYATDANNVWCNNYRYDGFQFVRLVVPPNIFTSQVNKIWVSPADALYFVDGGGIVAHYSDAKGWKRINTGFGLPIHDVFGVFNKNTGEKKVFLAVTGEVNTSESRILTLDGKDHIDSVKWNTGRNIWSVWTNNGNIVFTAGSGVFQNLCGSWSAATGFPPYYMLNVRGTGLNDVFACGVMGVMIHFNGVDWHYYKELYGKADIWWSIAVNEDCIVAVGGKGQNAVIAIGTRIK